LLLLFLLGIVVLRQVGVDAIKRLIARIQMGEQLDVTMMDAALILFAALLLMFPGFVTGGLGVLFLVPWLRRAAASKLMSRGLKFMQGAQTVAGEYHRVADNDEELPQK
jgi:UPF0716 protein FxsA